MLVTLPSNNGPPARHTLSRKPARSVDNQEPVCALVPFPIVGHADQDKTAMQPLALKVELEIALRQHLLRPLGSPRPPKTAVPKHECSAAISTFGNRPFEVAIIERVIFDLNGEPLVMRVEDGPLVTAQD